jgi:hypothetical protein
VGWAGLKRAGWCRKSRLRADGPQVGGLLEPEPPHAFPLIQSTCGWSARKRVGLRGVCAKVTLKRVGCVLRSFGYTSDRCRPLTPTKRPVFVQAKDPSRLPLKPASTTPCTQLTLKRVGCVGWALLPTPGPRAADVIRSLHPPAHLRADGPQVGGVAGVESGWNVVWSPSTCGWSAGRWAGWGRFGRNDAVDPTYVRVVRT